MKNIEITNNQFGGRAIINSQNLTRIELVIDRYVDTWCPLLEWKSELKIPFTNIVIREAGYHSTFSRGGLEYKSLKERYDEREFIVKGTAPNENVYRKAHVIFRYTTGKPVIKYFDLTSDAESFFIEMKQAFSTDNITFTV